MIRCYEGTAAPTRALMDVAAMGREERKPTMDKKTTEMTIPELTKVIPNMDAAALRAAYDAEKAAGADKERKGALTALEDAAKERNVDLTAPLNDGERAAAIPGAQPATGESSETEKADHAETLRELTERMEAAEAKLKAKEEGQPVTREEVLSLHRRLEALANHLNFRLPA